MRLSTDKRVILSILATITALAWFADAAAAQTIDSATVAKWSAPYRNWTYYPNHVIASDPKIPGYESFKNTDVPTVYQLPGDTKTWYMSFIAFNGQGYNSFVAKSSDLVHWSNPQLAMGFGKTGEFDYGGCVVGGYKYESYDIKAPRVLQAYQGKYWTLYGSYAKQGGYELAPGYEGVATSTDGLHWTREKSTPILSVSDSTATNWEKNSIFQPCLVEIGGTYYDFYNAGGTTGTEQSGVATSTNLLDWVRYAENPVIKNGNSAFDTTMASDPKVFRDGDHWTMIYFGLGTNGHADIMAAFSTDLFHWTASPEPLYAAGGNPSGLDSQYAHKISLVYNSENDTFYMYYCAVGNQGRGIGLITSKPISTPEPHAAVLLTTGSMGLFGYAKWHQMSKATSK